MKIYSRYLLGASMALILSASGPFTALALGAGLGCEFTEAYARLQDNQMDYDELEDLIKNYEPIKRMMPPPTPTQRNGGYQHHKVKAAREMEEATDDIEDAVSGQVEAEKIQDEMEKVYTNPRLCKAVPACGPVHGDEIRNLHKGRQQGNEVPSAPGKPDRTAFSWP